MGTVDPPNPEEKVMLALDRESKDIFRIVVSEVLAGVAL